MTGPSRRHQRRNRRGKRDAQRVGEIIEQLQREHPHNNVAAVVRRPDQQSASKGVGSTPPRPSSRRRIDPARLARALGLQVKRIGVGLYEVRGGSEPHHVTIDNGGRWRCNCADHVIRSAKCKHCCAVYLFRQLAGPVRDALREAVER